MTNKTVGWTSWLKTVKKKAPQKRLFTQKVLTKKQEQILMNGDVNEIKQTFTKQTIQFKTNKGVPVLNLVCLSQGVQLERVKCIVDMGAQIQHKDKLSRNALHVLCSLPTPPNDVVSFLIGKGININGREYKMSTALLLLCSQLDPCESTIRLLLSLGADPNLCDLRGISPLFLLLHCQKPNYELVSFLLSKGAIVDKEVNFHQQISSVNLFLDSATTTTTTTTNIYKNSNRNKNSNKNKKISTDQKNTQGKKEETFYDINENNYFPSAMCAAILRKDLPIKFADLLFQNGSDANYLYSSYEELDKFTILHLCCKMASQAILERIKLIVSYGGDLSIVDYYGHSTLHCACLSKNLNNNSTIQYLLQENVDYRLQTNYSEYYGCTILHLVCLKKRINLDNLKILLKFEDLIDIRDNKQRTALHYICQHPNVNNEILDLFISSKANISAFDELHLTPLSYLCKKPILQPDLILKFLKLNPNLLPQCDYLGFNPFFYTFLNKGNSSIPISLIQDYLTVIKDVNQKVTIQAENKELFENLNNYFSLYTKFSKVKLKKERIHNEQNDNYSDSNLMKYQGCTILHLLLGSASFNLKLIGYLLNSGCSLEIVRSGNITPLHDLCSNPQINEQILNLIIKKGGTKLVDIPDSKEHTPLHNLCANKSISIELLKILLSINFDHKVNIANRNQLEFENKNKKGNENGNGNEKGNGKVGIDKKMDNIKSYNNNNEKETNIENTKNLGNEDQKQIYNISNVKSPNDIQKSDILSRNALHIMCIKQPKINLQCVNLLLNLGIDINLEDKNSKSALNHLCSSKNPDIKSIKAFIKMGADVNSSDIKNHTPIMNLCYSNEISEELVKLFVNDYSVKLNKKSKKALFFNMTLLFFILKKGNASDELLDFLIESGLTVKTQNQLRSKTENPILYLCKQETFKVSYLQVLMKHKCDIAPQDIYKNTPLHYICSNPKMLKASIIELFLNHGINPDQKNSDSETPFSLATMQPNVTANIISLFLKSGVYITLYNHLKSPLFHNICKNSLNKESLQILKLLKKNGAPIEPLDHVGNTPLIVLCNQKKIAFDLIFYLIKKRAKINFKDYFGKTPLSYMVIKLTKIIPFGPQRYYGFHF
ncbi:ankyrin repeat-containing protein [Anaeramoeba flamelloides]|uniref:Ankyrin repeat-containing protein n=1 Tax=Anaeramoeba flamelloides TaxID=1746091 RepID=A0ABQ8Z8A8_9EUKA|nr:ankyrin repeat-containing protein [Anaeramoeba flamelloides]